MGSIDALTSREIAELVHAHAAQLMSADPRLTPPQAVRRAAELAVICFDALRLSDILRNAAGAQKVASSLADLVATRGGASLALGTHGTGS